MEEHSQQLAEIMHKIAFKVPWQTIKLEEHELRVLDKATGEQMVEIAYKNRIPFSRFIQQADELIDEFNEDKFRQYIRDVKELKNALEAPFKVKETQEIHIDPIDVSSQVDRERELIEAAVHEVLEGRYTDDIAIRESDENENLQQLGMMFNGKDMDDNQPHTFVSALTSHNELGTSISLQRGMQEPSLFMTSRIREDPLIMNFGEELEEPSLEELAKMGHLDGKTGRKIYDNIVNREQQDEIRRTEKMALEASERIPSEVLPPNVPDIDIPIDAIPPIVPDIDGITPVSLDIENIPPQMDIELPSIINPADVEKPLVDQMNTLPAIEQQEPALEPQTDLQQQSDQSVVAFESRIARIERAPSVHESQPATKGNVLAPKRKKRVRRAKKDILKQDVATFTKPLVVKPPKKMFKPRKHPNRVEINARNYDRDIFSQFENLPEYDIPTEEDFVEIINVLPEMSLNNIQEPVPVNPMETSPQKQPLEKESSVNKRAIASPEIELASKRARVELPEQPKIPPVDITPIEFLPIENNQFIAPLDFIPQEEPLIAQQNQSVALTIDNFLPENLIQEPQKDLYVTDYDPNNDNVVRDSGKHTPSIVNNRGPAIAPVNPSVSSVSDSGFKTPLPMKPACNVGQSAIIQSLEYDKFKKKLNIKNVDQSRLVSTNDVIYGQLRNMSKNVSAMNQVPPVPDISVAPVVPQVALTAPEDYREFKKKGISMLQFQNNQGKTVQYEEYNVENMMLYLQVRKYMKLKKTEKLNVDKLIRDKVLKLRHSSSNHVMMIRLWRLCDRGLFIGKWSDDDTKLLEIELPVKKTHSDKENVP